MSCFNELPSEYAHLNYKTTKLSASFAGKPALHEEISKTCAILVKNFINRNDYDFRVEEGSLTFQNKSYPRRVFKVFIDEGNSIFSEDNLNMVPDPVIVGIALSDEDPFVRRAIRDEIREYPDNMIYLDPVKYHKKYSLQPIYEYHYDLVIFKGDNSDCDYDTPVFEEFKNEIMKAVERWENKTVTA